MPFVILTIFWRIQYRVIRCRILEYAISIKNNNTKKSKIIRVQVSNQRFTVKTFEKAGMGPIYKIRKIMCAVDYLDIFETTMQ